MEIVFSKKKKVNKKVHETQISLQVLCVGRDGIERCPEVEAARRGRVSTDRVNGECQSY